MPNGYARERLVRTILGGVVAIGAVVFALLNPEQWLGAFVVALVGSGVVEPRVVLNWIRGGPNGAR